MNALRNFEFAASLRVQVADGNAIERAVVLFFRMVVFRDRLGAGQYLAVREVREGERAARKRVARESRVGARACE